MSIEAVDAVPPKDKYRRHDWDGLAEAGRSNPGQTFRMPIKHRSMATFVRQGKYKAFRDDPQDWEVETREIDGVVYIFATYSPRR